MDLGKSDPTAGLKFSRTISSLSRTQIANFGGVLQKAVVDHKVRGCSGISE